jgi:ethanolamine utilization protein EutN
MQLGKVIGTLVATQKCDGLEGVKFLVVQPLDRLGEPQGEPLVAADGTAQAGPGELVFMIYSREAALAIPGGFAPVDAAITGIVDQADVR